MILAAQAVGLPLVPPIRGGGDFSRGANFAFAGATAQDNVVLAGLGLDVTGWGNYSLAVEIEWFKDLLRSEPSLAGEILETHVLNLASDQREREREREMYENLSSCSLTRDDAFPEPTLLGNSLFMVGEIGGNDYNAALAQDIAVDQITEVFVPSTLIELGARNFIVPGNLPIGCVPEWLEKFYSIDSGDYDEHGCLVWMNDLSLYHNKALQDELNWLMELYPNVTISYADLFGSGMRMFSNPQQFGELLTVP
ncbi:hypothetical protein B296_00001674 [Ensete ventricosum]|uniref:Uncharacterized protein n=1 Tax=Ensete ventricosum TaxID=4639 RepID=A0A427ARP5_ENSVE|nr:hypothetical protein B296_00001674 [Ensete ventricosum]